MPEKEPLNIDLELTKLNELYQTGSQERAHILVIGEKASGKTTLIGTMPKPVFIMSFAPGGTQAIKEQITKGEVVVDTRYEIDDMNNPTAYKQFVKNFNLYRQEGFLNRFASFALDGLSEFGVAIKWHLMNKEGRRFPPLVDGGKSTRTTHGMQIQDWDQIINNMIMHTQQITSLPIHTMITGHVNRRMDEVILTYVRALSFPGQSSGLIPDYVPEFYCLQTGEIVDKGVKKTKRWLLTQNTGEYKCGTRMGAKERLLREEEPDITAMLKKVDFDYADKPLILM